ncbi:MAG TPA: hypothetical protein VF840_06100, partial [Terriglobales bacterium]
MKRGAIVLSSVLGFVLLLILPGCGSGSQPTTVVQSQPQPVVSAITMTVSPRGISLGASETQQFTATVTNTTNTAVTWTVSCSSAPCGTISASGLYTAPPVIPSAVTATVTATLQADSTKKGDASVNHVPLSVRVWPLLAMTMAAGATQTFTASIDKHSNQNVTWSLSGLGCTGGACGTLTNVTASSATYNAPATFAAAATAMVTATSVADATKSQLVKINLMPISEPLNGRYAFLFRASDSATVFGASLVADGKGNLSGIGDLVTASGAHANQPFTGSYALGADRRGTMQITGAGVTLTLRMVVVTGNFGRLLDFSGTGNGNGWFEKQNETAFSPAIMTGGSFALGGTSGSTFTSRVGDASWDSSGNGGAIAFYWYSYFAGCAIDSTTGRGTLVPNEPTDAMFSTAPHMAFYTVDATHALMLGDIGHPSLRLFGSMDAYANSELRGDYTYYMVTSTSLAAGRFTATPGADPGTVVISGVQDEVQDGGVNLDVPVTGGIGKGGFGEPILTLSIGGVSLGSELGFTTSDGRLLFVTENGSYGEAYLQKDGPFSNSTFTGNFGLQLFGRDAHALGMVSLAPPNLTGTTD